MLDPYLLTFERLSHSSTHLRAKLGRIFRSCLRWIVVVVAGVLSTKICEYPSHYDATPWLSNWSNLVMPGEGSLPVIALPQETVHLYWGKPQWLWKKQFALNHFDLFTFDGALAKRFSLWRTERGRWRLSNGKSPLNLEVRPRRRSRGTIPDEEDDAKTPAWRIPAFVLLAVMCNSKVQNQLLCEWLCSSGYCASEQAAYTQHIFLHIFMDADLLISSLTCHWENLLLNYIL